MSSIPTSLTIDSPRPRARLYYGWANVVVAALAMLGTLPGRTQGLGLVTEPLLADLHLGRSAYAQINFWATILGSLCCLSVGRWVDRFGARRVLVLVAAALGLAVCGMSAVTSVAALFLLVTLTRGLGQSALSIVSIALVGKWFRRRISLAMGVYAVLVGVLFAVAFGLVGHAVTVQGWRIAWREIGIALLVVLAPLAWLVARSTPEEMGLTPEEADGVDVTGAQHPTSAAPAAGLSLAEALRTSAFWIFALATSVYGLAYSGIGLFNEAILRELGFGAETYHATLAGGALAGLVSQMVAGWLGWRWSLRGVLELALAIYAASLVWLPHVDGLGALWANTVLMGAAGGMITVVFFAIWPATFGQAHLGRIQGAAQMLTVFSSALGPVLFAECQTRTGSYALALYALTPCALALAVAACLVRTPRR